MQIPKFADILALAETHHGSAGVKARLAELRRANQPGLSQSDDRFLSAMTKAVFSSGFSWSVVEQKWPGFEAAFDGFDPHRVAFYADDDMIRLLKDTRIIRNGGKIAATIANAHFVVDTATQHGSFGAFLRNWPPSDQIGLIDHFKQHAARLGGSSAMYFLRFSGWDAFILNADVNEALIREGVIDKAPTSKVQLRAVQDAFNAWTTEAGGRSARSAGSLRSVLGHHDGVTSIRSFRRRAVGTMRQRARQPHDGAVAPEYESNHRRVCFGPQLNH